MASSDGAVAVSISHAVRREHSKLLDSGEVRMVETKTEFQDGSFFQCSNSARGALLTQPPSVRRIQVLEETLPPDVLALHMQELERIVDRVPLRVETLGAFLAMEDRHTQIVSNFRKQIGYVDPEEIRRIALGVGKPAYVADWAAKSVDAARRLELASRGSRRVNDDDRINEMSTDGAS